MVVRENLMTQPDYRPYCGCDGCWARLAFNGEQFECWEGHYTTEFPQVFIAEWLKTHYPEGFTFADRANDMRLAMAGVARRAEIFRKYGL